MYIYTYIYIYTHIYIYIHMPKNNLQYIINHLKQFSWIISILGKINTCKPCQTSA